jgi:hypothetical protein
MKLAMSGLLLLLSQVVLSDKVIIGTPQSYSAFSKIIFEIKYVTQSRPLITGERISIQIPPFWQRPALDPVPAGSPPVSVRFSHPNTNGRLSISTTGIDGYSSIVGISVINIDILSSENGFADDTITITIGAEPVAEKGIRVTYYSGEQRLFYSRCLTNDIKSCANGKQFQTITVQPKKAKRIFAVTGSRLRSFDTAVVKIAMLDEYNNRDINYSGKILLFTSSGIKIWEGDAELGLCVARVLPGSAVIDSFKVTTEDGLIRWTNPFEINSNDSLRIWWGDPHTHTIYSGHGRGYINDLLEYAQNTSLLDFVAYTEHDWIDLASYVESSNAINIAHRDHSFAALHGLEWTSRMLAPATGYGHLGIISSNEKPIPMTIVNGFSRPDQIFDMSIRNNYLVTINHPVGNTPFDWTYYSKPVMKNVEMVSDGTLGLPDRNNEIIAEGFPGMAVRDIIKQGFQLGFFGVSDNHQSQPGIYSADVTKRSGLTAVFAEELTRQQLVKSMISRHNYTTTGARILLDVRYNRSRMGDIIKVPSIDVIKSIKFSVRIVGTSRISSIELIKDGQSMDQYSNFKSNVVDTVFFDRVTSLPTSYYIRVVQADGEKAWSSPIWFEQDGITTPSQCEALHSTFKVATKEMGDRLYEITVNASKSTNLTMDVYDILGRKVSSIVSEFITSGEKTYYWRKVGNDGSMLATGMYMLSLKTDFSHRVEKLLILR